MPQSTIRAKPECQFNPQFAIDVSDKLDSIEQKLDHIIEDLHGLSPIIPELAHAIRRTMILVAHVDSKVPDDPVRATNPNLKPKGKH